MRLDDRYLNIKDKDETLLFSDPKLIIRFLDTVTCVAAPFVADLFQLMMMITW